MNRFYIDDDVELENEDLYISINDNYNFSLTFGAKSNYYEKFLSELKNFSKDDKAPLRQWRICNAKKVYQNINNVEIINSDISINEGCISYCKCICSRELNYLFPIQNIDNGKIAFIGSSCINHFDKSMIDEYKEYIRRINKYIKCKECKKTIHKPQLWHKNIKKHRKCLNDDELFYIKNINMVFNFGKYKNKSVLDVFDKDWKYCEWVMNNLTKCENVCRFIELRMYKFCL